MRKIILLLAFLVLLPTIFAPPLATSESYQLIHYSGSSGGSATGTNFDLNNANAGEPIIDFSTTTTHQGFWGFLHDLNLFADDPPKSPFPPQNAGEPLDPTLPIFTPEFNADDLNRLLAIFVPFQVDPPPFNFGWVVLLFGVFAFFKKKKKLTIILLLLGILMLWGMI